jgi:hypothetical protein
LAGNFSKRIGSKIGAKPDQSIDDDAMPLALGQIPFEH